MNLNRQHISIDELNAVSVPARGIMNLNGSYRPICNGGTVSVPARGIMNLNFIKHELKSRTLMFPSPLGEL